MRIRRLSVKGFGCLVDREIQFPEHGLTLIIAENEHGKTTLAEALLAGLSGLPARRGRADRSDPKRRYQPWDSAAPYALELDLQADGKEYTVSRDFAGRAGFSVKLAGTLRDVAAESNEDLCAQFLHLSGDDYRRVALISGKEHSRLSDSSGLQDCLAAVVEGSETDTGVTAAVALLGNARFSYATLAPRLPKTAVNELETEIRVKTAGLAAAQAGIDQAEQQWTELVGLRERSSTLKSRQEALDIEFKAARLGEILTRIEEATSAAQNIERLEEEKKTLEQFANFPAERKANLVGAIARLDDNQERAKQARERLESLNSEARAIQNWMEPRKQFEGKTAEDAEKLRSAVRRIAECRANVAAKQVEIDRETQTHGQDASKTQKLEELYRKLPAQDLEFLSGYEQSLLASENAVVKCQAERQNSDQEISHIRESRARGKRTGVALAGVGLVAVAMSPLFVHSGAAMIGCVVVSALLVLGGIGIFSRSSGYEADKLAASGHARNQCDTTIATAENARQTAVRRLSDIAIGLGLPSGDAVRQGYKQLQAGSVGLRNVRELLAQSSQLKEQYRAAGTEGLFCCDRFGEKPEPAQLERVLRDLDANLTNYLAKTTSLNAIREQITTKSKELEGTEKDVQDDTSAVRNVLSEAGLDPDLPREAWLRAFEEREKCYIRYRDLSDKLIPAARERLVSQTELASRRVEAEELQQSLDGMTPETVRNLADIEKDRAAISEELSTVSSRIMELDRQSADGFADYRRSYSRLSEELAEAERLLGVAKRFGSAVELAKEVLASVSETTRRQWSTALNLRASAVLPALNPDYKSITFGDSLEIRVERASDGRVIEPEDIDTALSTGARDQVLLAARLAISAELSDATEAIPLILDDPFIATDDHRFMSGMRYLTENVAAGTQVIMLTCHESRHKGLEAQPWFESNVSIVRL